jgi:uroporphyrinogen decarboxylase
MLTNLPVDRPAPNGHEFIDIVMGRATSRRVPLVEYIVDDVLLEPITTDLLGESWVPWSGYRAAQEGYLDNFIAFWHRLGYDFVRFETSLGFSKRQLLAPDAAPASAKQRAWADEHQGEITSWSDFEAYNWPSVADMDFFPMEYICSHLPEGMGFITCHAGGVFEHLSQIMSLEGLCFALHDAPDLVRAVVDRIGELMLSYYDHLLTLDHLLAIFQGDDMGFRSATLVSPHDLREYCLPWQRRLAEKAHEAGFPYFLHSCGNLETIMEDLIQDVRIDAKHSYEDAITPVEDFQMAYGSRIGVLGGVDINILAGPSPRAVRDRTRFLIETCGGRRRYAIGSGNSIPSYVPVENYLAMIDEALDQ